MRAGSAVGSVDEAWCAGRDRGAYRLSARTDGFAAFLAIDGGSIVASIDASGHVRGHVELGGFDSVTAVEGGFVASRGAVRTVGPAARRAARARCPRWASRTITARGSDLVIATASGPRYLGYAFPANDLWLAGDADHVVVPGAGNRFLQLDANLAPVRELLPWTPRRDQATGLTWLGGDDWLVASASGLSLWTAGASTGTLALPEPSSGATTAPRTCCCSPDRASRATCRTVTRSSPSSRPAIEHRGRHRSAPAMIDEADPAVAFAICPSRPAGTKAPSRADSIPPDRRCRPGGTRSRPHHTHIEHVPLVVEAKHAGAIGFLFLPSRRGRL